MDLEPEEREIGKENYKAAVDVNRRDFLKGAVAAGAVWPGPRDPPSWCTMISRCPSSASRDEMNPDLLRRLLVTAALRN